MVAEKKKTDIDEFGSPFFQLRHIQRDKNSPKKLKEFNIIVKKISFYVPFEEAWNHYDLVDYFFSSNETKDEIKQLFKLTSSSIFIILCRYPPTILM